ncbi:DUF1648 domain-containing protein [Deinococcus koreensis]|uniref:DUF1648 domain-containing protein n=1 Tax=Deinococcus koreensis TaxID=2054903 RepID=UPI003C2D832F
MSFAVGVWALPRRAERVPVHWGADEADRWGSLAEGLFVPPVMLLSVSLLILAAARAQQASAPRVRRVVFRFGLIALFGMAAQTSVGVGSAWTTGTKERSTALPQESSGALW